MFTRKLCLSMRTVALTMVLLIVSGIGAFAEGELAMPIDELSIMVLKDDFPYEKAPFVVAIIDDGAAAPSTKSVKMG